MSSQLIKQASLHFGQYNTKERAFVYAMISCPCRLSAPHLRTLAEKTSWTAKNAQSLLLRLCSDGILTRRQPVNLMDRYANTYLSMVEFSPWGFAAVLQTMTASDVTTAVWARTFRADMMAERYASTDYEWLIKRAVSRAPGLVQISGAKEPATLIETFRSHLLFMMMEPCWDAFFGTLTEETCNSLSQDIDSFTAPGVDWESVMMLKAKFDVMHLSRQRRAEVNDWYRFYEFLRKGQPVKYASEMQVKDGTYAKLMEAVLALLAGNGPAASRAARAPLKDRRASRESIKCYKGLFENFILALSLAADRRTATSVKTLVSFVKFQSELERFEEIIAYYAAAVTMEESFGEMSWLWRRHENSRSQAARLLVRMLVCGEGLEGLGPNTPGPQDEEDARQVGADYAVLRQCWVAATQPGGDEAKDLEKKLAMKPLVSAKPRVPAWEKTINALLASLGVQGEEGAEVQGPAERIVYQLDTDNWSIQPRVQKTTNGRTWSAGRNVALKTFAEEGHPAMTPKDTAVAQQVRKVINWYEREYVLRGPQAVKALIGHPHVYSAKHPGQKIEVTAGALQLSVTREAGFYVVHTNIEGESMQIVEPNFVVLHCPMAGKVEVVDVTAEQKRLIETLEKAGPMPKESEDKLTQLLEHISSRMPVMSELLKNASNLEKQPGDSKITLQIAPDEAGGFAARAVVRPVEGTTVLCEPGKGLEYIAMNAGGKAMQVVRSLKTEKANFEALLEKIEFLDEARTDDTRWSLTVEGCLGLLNAAREAENVIVEWPDGVKFRVSHPTLTFANMQLSVNRMGTWFEVSGEASIDGKTKLQMAQLLRLVREAKGNFIALGKDEYVALTDGLKKQLAALDRLAAGTGTPQISGFNAGLIEELEKSGAAVTADKEFRDLQERIEKASDVKAKVPKGLQAELRDYQADGFEWMTRLASWGAGAVLADDMGLGKTVQTIAVLLSRAKAGPQLVVVPASVLYNWRDELERFAPSLKQVILNQAEDRADALKKAKKGTVVLTTYGVLASEIEAMAEKTWTTAVFDEAHNIKNKETKSFKAAVLVKADFRIMLTGTPLQNHLAEIWALFEVAVPGLLGTFNRFADRFVLPIERDKDREQQRLLKRIVSPFILRRTKTDVLNELPEKTEMTVKVELSPEERALYEELREETQQSLVAGEINPVQALASLMKLRQAACSPELVDPKLTLPSSKTQTFLRLAEELIENNHRALVFSQFTSHLALIRRALDAEKIEYLYLDGSMTPAQRQKLVERFEEGSMPLFLISLKAGGTGLNLTAADYVIHMDPWWNPAIEDQASDRAYRIGQERPVTIYRLIAEGTVEEKILKLHGTKKSLADALLEGTEMSSRLGRDEIMELLALAQ